MAITFLAKRRRQRYMILVFMAVVSITLGLIWHSFLREEKPKEILLEEIIKPLYKKAEINWSVLKDPQLEILQPFPQILPFEEEVGRENPFEPY